MNIKLILIAGVGVAALGGGAFVLLGGRHGGPDGGAKPLTSASLAVTRRDALAMFPRGTPVRDVADGLQALGFRCTPGHRLAANVNAPYVQCESAGRGYPTTPRLDVTVMARDGALSDIAVGSGVDSVVADARSPDQTGGFAR